MIVDAAREHSPLVAALPREETARHTVAVLAVATKAFAAGRGLSAGDQRGQLLRQLLLGAPDADPRQLRQLGLDPSARYHCVVTAEREAHTAEALEARLSGSVRGLFGLVNGVLAGMASGPPQSEAV